MKYSTKRPLLDMFMPTQLIVKQEKPLPWQFLENITDASTLVNNVKYK